jgi:hypothetical protein
MVRVALVLLMASSAGGVPADCPALGFTESLACSACDKLQEHVKNELLLGECRSALFLCASCPRGSAG